MARMTKNSVMAMQELIEQAEQERAMQGEISDPGAVGIDADEMSDDMSLTATLQQIGESGTEAKVIVYQIDEGKKKDIWLFDCPVSEFANGGLSEIQIRYGAGEYRVRVYSGNKLLTHRRITIGAPRIKQPEPTPQLDVATMIAQNNAAMLAGFKEIAASMRPVAGGGAGMGVQEVIGLLGTLMPMMQPARQAPQSDPFDMVMKVLQLQKDLAPVPEGEAGTVNLIMKAMDTFGKPIAEAMANQKAQQAAYPQPSPQQQCNVSQLPAPVENPITNPTEGTKDMTDLEMKIGIIKMPMLLMADTGADTYPYACMLLDTLDDAEVAQFVTNDNWFAELCKILPEAQSRQQWFEQLRANALSLLQEPEEDVMVSPINSITPAKSA